MRRTIRRLRTSYLAALLVCCNGSDGNREDGDAMQDSLEDHVDVGDDAPGDDAGDALDDFEPCTSPLDCDDANPCTTDECDLETGDCVHHPTDQDDDGFIASVVEGVECGGNDCDDGDDTIYPEADPQCDGLDHDCNDLVDRDEDGDGHLSAEVCPETGDDCDDHDGDVHPGITPGCAERDTDCDGVMDCTDPSCTGYCPCTLTESDCEDEVDDDCDLLVDCADDDCADAPCCTGTPCTGSLTCCASGCCNLDADVTCCGTCSVECSPEQKCCDGECAECCSSADCDDLNPCTLDLCAAGACINDGTVTDMLPCPGGVCCSGACQAPGNCCTDSDCGCRGSAAPCYDFDDDQATCELQSGCAWEDHSCLDLHETPCGELRDMECEGGPCSNCAMAVPSGVCGTSSPDGLCDPVAEETCEQNGTDEINCTTCGCTWTGTACTGVPDCTALNPIHSWLCFTCPGCLPREGEGDCTGAHVPCSSHTDETTCTQQSTCDWLPTCVDHICAG